MADLDITDNNVGRNPIVLKAGQTISDAHDTNMRSISKLKTYLEANGYTAAQTRAMTKNDLIYAYRVKNNLL